MQRTFLAVGGLLGFLAVAAGAFGAHALTGRLSPDRLDTFELAVRYQMYHALALVGLAALIALRPAGALHAAGWLFVAGVAVFCGTLYGLAFGGPRWLGAITPIGGTAFLLGWAAIVWGAVMR